ncbi:MAG: hypothetical protein IJ547_03555 [Clostridia bacterium]|nr:hypothetical protein [Clostridia bacterium]
MATDLHRYSISLDDDTFDKVENFRYEERFPTRSSATLELIKLGLEALEAQREKETENEKTSS